MSIGFGEKVVKIIPYKSSSRGKDDVQGRNRRQEGHFDKYFVRLKICLRSDIQGTIPKTGSSIRQIGEKTMFKGKSGVREKREMWRG